MSTDAICDTGRSDRSNLSRDEFESRPCESATNRRGEYPSVSGGKGLSRRSRGRPRCKGARVRSTGVLLVGGVLWEIERARMNDG